MKKIYILFAIIALFVVQFGVRNVVYAADENVDFTDESYSNLNTEKVEYMLYMFSDCSRFSSLDLSNFNTSNVIHF